MTELSLYFKCNIDEEFKEFIKFIKTKYKYNDRIIEIKGGFK